MILISLSSFNNQPFGLKLCKDNPGDQYNVLVFRAVGLLVGGGLQPIYGQRRRSAASLDLRIYDVVPKITRAQNH